MNQPIKSKSVSAGTRMYYFDIYNDTNRHPFLAITEEAISSQFGKRRRQKIFIHGEDFLAFQEAFNEMAAAITQ